MTRACLHLCLPRRQQQQQRQLQTQMPKAAAPPLQLQQLQLRLQGWQAQLCCLWGVPLTSWACLQPQMRRAIASSARVSAFIAHPALPHGRSMCTLNFHLAGTPCTCSRPVHPALAHSRRMCTLWVGAFSAPETPSAWISASAASPAPAHTCPDMLYTWGMCVHTSACSQERSIGS